jgi:hypothetical protein
VNSEPTLSLNQAKDIVAAKTAPKITEASIKDRISYVDYLYHRQLTICIITMSNGFMVQGVSAPASPINFDMEVGKRYAYDNAFKQLWQLEGYLLREKLSTSAL